MRRSTVLVPALIPVLLAACAELPTTYADAPLEPGFAKGDNLGLIAFASFRDGPFLDVYTMNDDGTDVNRLTTTSTDDFDPAWSPDGRQIIYVKRLNQFDMEDLYIMNADGTGHTPLTRDAGRNIHPDWSPKGRNGGLIAFASNRDGDFEIYTTPVDGFGATRLTFRTGADVWPTWSPDGKRIAFASAQTGVSQIYEMDADGRNVTQLTFGDDDAGQPSWSPDGRRIAFIRDQAVGVSEIFVMNADGTGETRITGHGVRSLSPDWSPDGLRITYSSGVGTGRDLYSIGVDGSGLQRLTFFQKSQDPAWSSRRNPNGKF